VFGGLGEFVRGGHALCGLSFAGDKLRRGSWNFRMG